MPVVYFSVLCTTLVAKMSGFGRYHVPSLLLVQCQHPIKKVASSSCAPHAEDVAADSSCLFLQIYLSLLCLGLAVIVHVTYSLSVPNKPFLKGLNSAL